MILNKLPILCLNIEYSLLKSRYISDIKYNVSPNFKIKYKINILTKGKLEYVFLIMNIDITRKVLEEIYNCIIYSTEFELLGDVKMNLMTGLTQGDWLSIGHTFVFNPNIEMDEFVNHYLDALKNLKDKHYSVYEFDIFLCKLIDVSPKKKNI